MHSQSVAILSLISILSLMVSIVITQTIQCQLSTPTFGLWSQSLVPLGTSQTVDVTQGLQKFDSNGADCFGVSTFTYEAYAEFQDRTRLPKAYLTSLIANLQGDSVNLILTPQTNREATEAHAVYVKVTDKVDVQATNSFCFMVTDTPDNFCQEYCQTQGVQLAKQFPKDEIKYFIAPVGSVQETVSVEGEFNFISQNPLQCPVIHNLAHIPNASFASQSGSILNFNQEMGSFEIFSNDQSLQDPDPQTELYQISATNPSGITQSHQIRIIYQGCQQETIVENDQNAQHQITYQILQGANPATQIQKFSHFGFQSSNPTPCPLSISITLPVTSGPVINLDTVSNVLTISNVDPIQVGTPIQLSMTATMAGSVPPQTLTKLVNIQFVACEEVTAPGCISCDASLIADKSSLFSDSVGCTQCLSSYEEYLYKSELTSKIVRGCRVKQNLEVTKAFQQCGWGKIRDQNLVCTPCEKFIPGCSLCVSNLKCLECDQPLKSIDIFQNDGTVKSLCTQDLCFNCAECSIPNCKSCSRSNPTQSCYMCDQGFYLDPISNECKAPLLGVQDLEYYVLSFEGTSMSDPEIADLNTATGTSLSDSFFFIPQAINRVYNAGFDPRNYSEIRITIYIGKGDHFLFSCFDEFVQNAQDLLQNSSITDFCSKIPTLAPQKAQIDNLKYKLQPLNCVDKVQFTLSAAQSIVFDLNCVPNGELSQVGPFIHALDPYFNFNVTGEFSVENLAFTGQHQLAIANSYQHGMQMIPVRKCGVDNSHNGEYRPLNLITDQLDLLPQVDFSCQDTNFEQAQIPMKQDQSCAELQESQIEIKRMQCASDLTQKEYYERDSTSGIAYKRHRSLFVITETDSIRTYNQNTLPTLSIKECSFEFFLTNYTSLIVVDNFDLYKETKKGEQIMYQTGNKQGIRLDIDQSSFKNSRFCQGLIFYTQTPEINNISQQTLINLSNQVQRQSLAEPLILVSKTEFINLNFGKTVKHLRYIDQENSQSISKSIPETDIQVPIRFHQGQILNSSGFPGIIEFAFCKFDNNLVFFSDMYPMIRIQNVTVDRIEDYLIENTEGQFVKTTRCTNEGKVKRLLSDALTTVDDFVDQDWTLVLEKVSPIVIEYPERDTIFRDNTFANNTGLFGGAISIDTPNLQQGDMATHTTLLSDQRPKILFWNNTFEHNQAYLSGNAIHVRFTRQLESPDEKTSICGGMLHAERNTFKENLAISQISHGGAISLVCDYVETKSAKSSNYGGTEYWRVQAVSDKYTTEQYRIYKYASSIFNNTFELNSAGMKGGVIYARDISYLLVTQNEFKLNVSPYSFFLREDRAPYYKKLSLSARKSLFHYPQNTTVTNEFQYINWVAKSFREGGLIDLPQFQGTIYASQCERCMLNKHEIEQSCKFCLIYPSMAQISENKFENNTEDFFVFEEHNQERASQIQLIGFRNHEINLNNFWSIQSQWNIEVERQIPAYFFNIRQDYFKMLHSPLIRIKLHEGLDSLWDGKNSDFTSISQTHISENYFVAIQSAQPYLDNLKFKGSLVHFESETVFARVNMTGNKCEDNFVLGDQGSLFYFKGAALNATDNIVIRSGYLDTEYKNITRSNYFGLDHPQHFPIEVRNGTFARWTQDRGIFFIEGVQGPPKLSQNVTQYSFEKNMIDFFFCIKGCFSSWVLQTGDQPIYATYENNTFTNLISQQGSILDLDVLESNEFKNEERNDNQTFFIANIKRNKIENVWNGALRVRGMNHEAIITMKDQHMVDCFGSQNTTTIDIENANFFVCSNCTFQQINQAELKIQIAFDTFMDRGYGVLMPNRGSFDSYITNDALYSLFQNSSNQLGTIRLKDVDNSQAQTSIQNITIGDEMYVKILADDYQEFPVDPAIWIKHRNNTWVRQNPLTEDQWAWLAGNPPFLPHSLIKRSNFTGIIGQNQSILALEKSKVFMNSTFISQNVALGRDSTTLRVERKSELQLFGSIFRDNRASIGGAIYASDHSLVNITGVIFENIESTARAGVLFAENDSRILIKYSRFYKNKSRGKASILMADNCFKTPLEIRNSVFEMNEAIENSIELLYSQAIFDQNQFINNVALSGTHGINLVESQVQFTNQDVHYSLDYSRNATQFVGASSGFFLLQSRSRISLQGQNVIKGTFGTVASFALIQGQSYLFMQGALIAGAQTVTSSRDFEQTGVIVGLQSEQISLDQVTFANCHNTHILADRTQLLVTQSHFSRGENSHGLIKAYGSVVNIQSSNFRESKNLVSQGQALLCRLCPQVYLQNNIFQDLVGYQGGALFLDRVDYAEIFQNTFYRNRAEQGGAIYILDSVVKVQQNSFQENKALALRLEDLKSDRVDPDLSGLHEGSGGAIFYTCVDQSDATVIYKLTEHLETCKVDIFMNKFQSNEATDKGGALTWKSKNFTIAPDSNTFLNNTAGFEDQIASPPSKIEIEIEVGPDSEIDPLFPDFSVNFNDTSKSPQQQIRESLIVTSGQSFKLLVRILDANGNVYEAENQANAVLTFLGDDFPPFGKLYGNQKIAKNGVFDFSDISVIFQPGSQQLMELRVYNLKSYGNQLDFLEVFPKINLIARECRAGERYTEERTCEKCPAGFFGLEIQRKVGDCQPCPRNAICPGANLILPMQGFTRMHKNSRVFIQCFNPEACEEGTKSMPLGRCASGYQGEMCATCVDSRWRNLGSYGCYECNMTLFQAYVLKLFQLLFFVTIIVTLVKIFQRNFGRPYTESLAIIRILIGFYQFVAILSKLQMLNTRLAPAQTFQTLLDLKVSWMMPQYWLSNFDCFQIDKLSEQYFNYRLGYHVFMPFGLLLANLLIWSVAMCIKTSCRESQQARLTSERFRSRVLASSSFCVFIVYPTILEVIFQYMRCIKSVSDETVNSQNSLSDEVVTYRMANQPGIECFTGRHFYLFWFMALPAGIWWGLIFPLFVLKRMIKSAPNIYNSTLKADQLAISEKAHVATTKSIYGFLFQGLQIQHKVEALDLPSADPRNQGEKLTFAKYLVKLFRYALSPIAAKGVRIELNDHLTEVYSFYYWEFVIYCQKLILLFLVIFASNLNQGLQENITLVTISFFFFLQLFNRPYVKARLNFLQLMSLLTCFLLVYCRVIIKSFNMASSDSISQRMTPNGTFVSNDWAVSGLSDSTVIEISRTGYSSDQTPLSVTLLIIFVILAFLIVEIIFVWALYIHLLRYVLDARRVTLFRFLTLGIWSFQKFRTQYMRSDFESTTEDSEDLIMENGQRGTPIQVNGKVAPINFDNNTETTSSKGSDRKETHLSNFDTDRGLMRGFGKQLSEIEGLPDYISNDQAESSKYVSPDRKLIQLPEHMQNSSRNNEGLAGSLSKKTSIVSARQIDLVQDDRFRPSVRPGTVLDGFSAEQSFVSSDLTDRNKIEAEYQSQMQVEIIPIDMAQAANQNIPIQQSPQKSKTRKEAWTNSSKHRRVTSSVSSSSQGYLMKSSRMEEPRTSVVPNPVLLSKQIKNDSFVTEIQHESELKPYESSELIQNEEEKFEGKEESKSDSSIVIKPRASYHPELALRNNDQDSSVSLSIGDEDLNQIKKQGSQDNPFSKVQSAEKKIEKRKIFSKLNAQSSNLQEIQNEQKPNIGLRKRKQVQREVNEESVPNAMLPKSALSSSRRKIHNVSFKDTIDSPDISQVVSNKKKAVVQVQPQEDDDMGQKRQNRKDNQAGKTGGNIFKNKRQSSNSATRKKNNQK